MNRPLAAFGLLLGLGGPRAFMAMFRRDQAIAARQADEARHRVAPADDRHYAVVAPEGNALALEETTVLRPTGRHRKPTRPSRWRRWFGAR